MSSFSKDFRHRCLLVYLDSSSTDKKSVYLTGNHNLTKMNWEQLSCRQVLETKNDQTCELPIFIIKNFLNHVIDKHTPETKVLSMQRYLTTPGII